MHHTLPENLPIDWIASKKLPSCDGRYESWYVIHKSESKYHPYVVHTAWYVDEGASKGTFEYAYGSYCVTLEEAYEIFNKKGV